MIAGLRGAIARNLPQPLVQAAFDILHSRTQLQSSIAAAFLRCRTGSSIRGMGEGIAPVMHRGQAVLARRIHQYSAVKAAESNLAVAVDAAEAAAIEYQLQRPGPSRAGRLVLKAEDLPAFVNAAVSTTMGRPIYATVGKGASVLLRELDPVPAGAWSVFEYLASDGFVLADEGLACEVSAGDARDVYPDVGEPMEPIDAVYTWVDGSDERWAIEKSMAWSQTNQTGLNRFSANNERYRSRDELLYSLRSLDYFAPWINHVYVVTAGQIPKWLDTSNPRLTVIDHSEIFPGDALPTFNSHAIEARLHHIPGLSEHFLYLNDDVFLGRPVEAGLFFHGNGLPKFFLSDQTIEETPPASTDLPVDSAAKQNRLLLQQRFGRSVRFKFKHAAHAQRISTLRAVEQDFEAKHASTTRSQFRSPEDISIPASLAHYYGYMIGAAVPGDLRYCYCDIGGPSAQAKLLRLLRDRDADVFCLNEIGGSALDLVQQDELVQRFLRSYYPVPSSFEHS